MKPIIPLAAILLIATTTLAEESKVEEPKIEIIRVDIDDNVYTPYFPTVQTGQNNELGAAKRWIKITVEYSTEGTWIDHLSIDHKAIVGLQKGIPTILEEKVTYMNVGPGNHTSSVYMHPNCVERYEADASEIDMAVDFRIGDKIVVQKHTAHHFEEGWLTSSKYNTSMVHLLSEDETPFWLLNYDFKEIIKNSGHSLRDQIRPEQSEPKNTKE